MNPTRPERTRRAPVLCAHVGRFLCELDKFPFYLQLDVSQRFPLVVIVAVRDKMFYQVCFTKHRLARLTHTLISTWSLPLGSVCFHESYLLESTVALRSVWAAQGWPTFLHWMLYKVTSTSGKSPRWSSLTPKGIEPCPFCSWWSSRCLNYEQVIGLIFAGHGAN